MHSQLGPDLLEAVYAKATAAELTFRGLQVEAEYVVPVMYRGKVICHHRLDLFIHRRLVVEIKAVEHLLPIHVAQVLSYLKISGAKIGLLLNFNVEVLKSGIRRVVLSPSQAS